MQRPMTGAAVSQTLTVSPLPLLRSAAADMATVGRLARGASTPGNEIHGFPRVVTPLL